MPKKNQFRITGSLILGIADFLPKKPRHFGDHDRFKFVVPEKISVYNSGAAPTDPFKTKEFFFIFNYETDEWELEGNYDFDDFRREL